MTEEYNPDSAPYDPEDFSYGGGDYRSFDDINYEDDHQGGQDEGHNNHLDSHGQRQFSPSEYHDHDREDEFPFGSKLFIGNLASERTSKHELHKIFSVYGEIVDIMIKRSFGTVQFATTEACNDAISNENGRPIQGLRIDLRIFEPHRRPGRHDDRRGGHSSRRGGFDGPSFRGRGRGRGTRARGRGGRARGRGRGFDQPPYYKDRYEDHGSNYDSKPFRGRGGPGRGRDSYRQRPYDRDYDPRHYRGEDRPYGREPYHEEYEDSSHDGGYQHYPRQDPSFHSGYSDSSYNPQSRPPTGPAASAGPPGAHPEGGSEESEFLLPRRYGDQIPFCQIIVLDQIDRQFIWHVENSLRGSSISVDTLFISPKISLRSVIRQMILEGVHAVIFIEKQHQVMQKVSLQVFDQKSRVGDNVKFDAYDNVSVDEALAVMMRHKETLSGQAGPKNPQESQPASGHSTAESAGQYPPSQPQQPMQQLPSAQPTQPQNPIQNLAGNALLNPLLGTGGNIDFGAIASLLQTLQQQQ
ncbi:nuclear polyadenylated RNA-binding protein 3, partial [Basidiobolus ranarum]